MTGKIRESQRNIISRKQTGWLLWGSLISFALGASFHFGFDKTGFAPLSIVCATNESIWEHMKILFFGGLFYNCALYFSLFRKNINFIVGAAAGLLAIVILVPAIVVTYSTLAGGEVFIVDFLLSLVIEILCQFIILWFLKSRRDFTPFKSSALFLCLLLVVVFIVFRFSPPAFGIFLPPA